MPSFLFYSPSYIHLFIIYAFCRIDDLSWGTKGLDANSKDSSKMQNTNLNKKVHFVIKWMLINGIFGFFFASLTMKPLVKSIILMIFAGFLSLIIIIRCIFSITYYLWYWFYFKIKIAIFVYNKKDDYKSQSHKNKYDIKEDYRKTYYDLTHKRKIIVNKDINIVDQYKQRNLN